VRLAPRASLALAACLLLAAFASFALSTVNAYSNALLRIAAVAVVLSGWLVNRALGGMGGCRIGLSALALALGLGALSSCDESERDRARLGKHLYVLRLSPDSSGRARYRLEECSPFGFSCRGFDTTTSQSSWEPQAVALVVDEHARTVSVTLDGNTTFSYRTPP